MNQPITIRQRLESPAFNLQIAKVLPRHLSPERFIRVAITTITKIPKLADCDQYSFFNALLNLSQFGLEPDGRRAHLIPFENRKRGCVECQLIIDYKGLAELVMRSGQVTKLHADKVCDADEFEYDCGEVKKHRIDLKKPRGKPYAYYALAVYQGMQKADLMSLDEIESIRKRSRAGNNGPWVTDFDEMAKKTVFRRLSKWLPLSSEIRDAAEGDDDTVIDIQAQPVKAASLVDSTPFEVPPQAPEQPQSDDKEEAAAGLAPETAQSQKPAEPSPQMSLGNVIQNMGYSFTTFQAWAKETGALSNADSFGTYDEIPTKDAERLIRVFRGSTMKAALEQLAAIKAGGVV